MQRAVADSREEAHLPFIAVDWGTTNRRVYRIERGNVVATERDDIGILSVPMGGFPAQIAELRTRFGGLPIVRAGMVGSDRGWHDAGYVCRTATIESVAAAMVQPEHGVAIVPGVCVNTRGRTEVMRGEEVQLLGAVAAGLAPVDALLCQPGTHSKWAVMKDGAIADFTTAMTGEMFALLKSHALIGREMYGDVEADAAFREGVETCADTDLLSALFGVRAASLLGKRAPGEAAAYVSGLLIGSDCRARITRPGMTIHLLADGLLSRLYSAAITIAGGRVVIVDSQVSFIAGIARIRNLMS
ncbi:MAG: 2-oxo-3-deoxygalactonate kinase [Novosphingobium lindaniclasticum]|jgi:2-dehydro-3-deoxygalactonokinase|uniref:2-dehydro-3-deoxygalactonokinase n=1 Tax=Novosphingobium lindaniclasticum TaxID=1329895 RepID=UPI00240A8231|nr:2-dehydro-3-deoxygalactonokinase [Novosphingobium lindaniclasticum]MDF2640614.1 2-oxo-3-deoxygalactonate kinase [Novosphingobium lindaniclasticum]